jgi:cell division protein FtsB
VKLARRAVWPILLAATVMVIMFYAVFPTRTWLDQRSTAEARATELAEIEATNADLLVSIERLQTDEEIERLARADYSLVYPGEEAYAILPQPPEPLRLPATWPLDQMAKSLAQP